MAILVADIGMFLTGGSSNANPNASLGGNVSNVEVVSDKTNNLFRRITETEAQSGITIYRCVAIKNKSLTDTMTGVVFYQVSDTVSVDDLSLYSYAQSPKNTVETTIVNEFTAPTGSNINWIAARNRGGVLPTVTPAGGTNDGLKYTFSYKFGSKGNGNGQFQDPHDASFDSAGNVFITDRIRNDVQKFSPDGTYISKFGSSGSTDGKLNVPYSAQHDASDNIYIADRENNRIQKFNSSGVYVSKITTVNGKALNAPEDVTFDRSNGDIYILDTGNNRCVKLNSAHTFILQWGKKGSANGQFNHPHSINTDSSGNVYISCGNQPYIQKFTKDGVFIKKWGSEGSGPGQVKMFLEHMDIDKFNRVHLVNNDVRPIINVWDTEGKWLCQYGNTKSGSADGQFKEPEHITCDKFGKPFVVDAKNQRIQVFSMSTTTPTPPPPSTSTGGGLQLGNLAPGEFINVWMRVSVNPGALQFTDNFFKMRVEVNGTTPGGSGGTGGGGSGGGPPPPPDDVGVNLRMAVQGDTGSGSTFTGILKKITSKNTDMIIFNGDLAYASSMKGWLSATSNVRSKSWVSFGNHDVNDGDGSKTTINDLLNAYGISKTYYSKTFQNVGIVVMEAGENQSVSSSASSAQYTAVKNALQGFKNNSAIEWIFVFNHYPIEGPRNEHHSNEDTVKSDYDPLFDANGVDAVFSSHNHVMWRTKLLKYNSGSPNSPTVVASGPDFSYNIATANHGKLWFCSGAGGKSHYSNGSQPSYSAFSNDSKYGYLLIRFENNAKKCTFLFYDSSDNLLDTSTITHL